MTKLKSTLKYCLVVYHTMLSGVLRSAIGIALADPEFWKKNLPSGLGSGPKSPNGVQDGAAIQDLEYTQQLRHNHQIRPNLTFLALIF